MKKSPRFPALAPKGFCRGCKGPILEKRRLTWCSQACKNKFDPYLVKLAVASRSGKHCEKCGRDCSPQSVREHRQQCPREPRYHELGLPYPHNSAAWYAHPAYTAYREALLAWKRYAPKPEYDHIIPHSEGGPFTVENIRLLCRPCHRAVTAEWRRARSGSVA